MVVYPGTQTICRKYKKLVMGAIIEAFTFIIFYAFNSAGKGRGDNEKKSD